MHIATIGPAQSLQRLPERGEAGPCFLIVRGREHADAARALGLLRTRRDRPNNRRAGETGDEFASPHGRCPLGRRQYPSTSWNNYGAVRGTAKALMSALGQKRK